MRTSLNGMDITPRAPLYRLQKAGIRAKVASRQFRMRIPSVADSGNVRLFDYGTILIPMGIQKMIRKPFETSCKQSHAKTPSMYLPSPPDRPTAVLTWAARGFVPLKTPQIALLIGKGTDVYNAGEVWHLLDQHYNIAISLIDASHVRGIDLNRYNTVIAAGGSYSTLDSTGVNALKQWLRRGNTLIALNSAVHWAINSKLASAQYVGRNRENRSERKAYIDASSDRGAQIIGGAIFQTYLGPHPSPRLWVSQRQPASLSARHPLSQTRKPLRHPFAIHQTALTRGL